MSGIVQGVGFRPFVYQLALRHALKGEVANTAAGVVIHVEGAAEGIAAFCRELRSQPPPLAHITDVAVTTVPAEAFGEFRIAASRGDAARSALISPDVSICEACAQEVTDPGNRRFHYPFTNCTDCGPRYTIIDDIPYDRPSTSMRHFTMCPRCQAEYDDPLDRRFHAQPNACADCGPRVTLVDRRGRAVAADDPLARTAALIADGRILAIKGLGGFHLAVDACNGPAVRRLRLRKGREEKPFALMCRDLAQVEAIARADEAERALLTGIQRPIVILAKREPNPVAEEVSPRNRYLGVMLPYTPLHYLLMAGARNPWVMTSGNLSEEPICIDNDEALERLGGIADYFLMHNRDIYLRSDDSIVRRVAGRTRPVRRSRGYVPVPVFLRRRQPSVLACGAELKNTVCLTSADRAFLSQHIGDLENLETYRFLERTVDHLQRILDIRPEVAACDLHPDYLSTRYAEALSGVEKIRVQHHHAHIVSCMAENRLEGTVIGLAFDGTGYGTDGRIWGGEVLVAGTGGFERAACLGEVPMPGGAAAIREPWRMGVSYLFDAYGAGFRELDIPFLKHLDGRVLEVILGMMQSGLNTPLTSSVGRLFDGIAALAALRDRVNYEGQAAVELEMASRGEAADTGVYDYGWESGGDCRRIPTAPVIRGVVGDLVRGRPVAEIGARFHHTLIALFTDICETLGKERGLRRVALSGGSFQNAVLLEGMIRSLARRGFEVFTHTRVPANDGGISLGQAVAAGAMAVAGKGGSQ